MDSLSSQSTVSGYRRAPRASNLGQFFPAPPASGQVAPAGARARAGSPVYSDRDAVGSARWSPRSTSGRFKGQVESLGALLSSTSSARASAARRALARPARAGAASDSGTSLNRRGVTTALIPGRPAPGARPPADASAAILPVVGVDLLRKPAGTPSSRSPGPHREGQRHDRRRTTSRDLPSTRAEYSVRLTSSILSCSRTGSWRSTSRTRSPRETAHARGEC